MSAQPASDPAPQRDWVWWEKTVEYKFVIDCLSEVTHAFPLAGNAERDWGDLLLKQLQGDEWQFRVIEFKRTRTEIDDEKLKFASMHKREGRQRIADKSEPFHKLLEKNHKEQLLGLHGYDAHWLIYGDQPVVDKAAERAADGKQLPARSPLELRYRQYGADGDCGTLSREALLKLPHVNHWEMREYLTALARARRFEHESSSSETARGEGAFDGWSSKILGVTDAGTVSLLISAEEFFQPELLHKPKIADLGTKRKALTAKRGAAPRGQSTPQAGK